MGARSPPRGRMGNSGRGRPTGLEKIVKDQLVTIMEAIRIAQDLLEVEGHTQETLEALRSILCNEDVCTAAERLSFVNTPSAPPDVPFLRGWQERLQAA